MQRPPPCLQVVLERARAAGGLQEYVAGVAGVRKHGLHHRLLQRLDARARPRIVPLLERMEVRQNQVRRGRRLVQVGREAHLVRDAAERLGERGRQGVRRIRAVDEQQRDLPSAHVPDEVRQLLERSAGLEGVRSEEHTSELQSQSNLVCRLLLEKKKMRIVPADGWFLVFSPLRWAIVRY